MATRKSTRGRQGANSSLPGPPDRTTVRPLQRQLPFCDAGPHADYLALECLRRICTISDHVLRISRHIDVVYNEDVMLRIAAQRTREFAGMLRAYFERDPSVSLARVHRRLRQVKYRVTIDDAFDPPLLPAELECLELGNAKRLADHQRS
jgi:hypothetical protein